MRAPEEYVAAQLSGFGAAARCRGQRTSLSVAAEQPGGLLRGDSGRVATLAEVHTMNRWQRRTWSPFLVTAKGSW